MRIKELLCVGSLAASILTAGCNTESPTSPEIEEPIKHEKVVEPIIDSASEPVIDLVPKTRIPREFSGKPFKRQLRVFYVEDRGTSHSDDVSNWIWDEVERSRKFFANEMSRHNLEERTFDWANGEVERIFADEDIYLNDYDNRNKDIECNEHAKPLKNRLSKINRVDNENRLEIHIYIVNFQLKCFEGLYFLNEGVFAFDAQILIDAHDSKDEDLYEIIAHELGHAYGLIHDSERNDSIMNVPYRREQEGTYKVYEDQASKMNRLDGKIK